MSGSLIKIDQEIITSATSSTYLQGIDSTYEVYVVTVNNLKVTTDNTTCRIRVGSSGSADTTTNYDWNAKTLYASTFINQYNIDESGWYGLNNMDAQNGANTNATLYLFNWQKSDEWSFITIEASALLHNGSIYSHQGSAVHTVDQSNSEIHFVMDSSTIASAEFTLYGLKN